MKVLAAILLLGTALLRPAAAVPKSRFVRDIDVDKVEKVRQ